LTNDGDHRAGIPLPWYTAIIPSWCSRGTFRRS